MTVEKETTEFFKSLRLQVVTEADPSALARVLAHFQNLNIVPHRIGAEFSPTGLMHIHVDVSGLPEDRLTVIAAKIAQVVPVVNAYWHYL
jgi:hypothetical protein